MKSNQIFSVIMYCIIPLVIHAQSITYISPVNNSQFNSRQTNIIVRSGEIIDPESLTCSGIIVNGSVSGVHPGTMRLSDDRKTMLFSPNTLFLPGEIVTVTAGGNIRTIDGKYLEQKQFSFTITKQPSPLSEKYSVSESGDVIERNTAIPIKRTAFYRTQSDSLPPDFPKLKLISTDNPAEGNYYMSIANDIPGVGYFLMMIDNNGQVVKYKRTPDHTYDFKIQPNGLITYGNAESPWNYAGGNRTVHYVVDTNLAVVDSFKAGNGYDADGHEFLMLPNGHVLLHAYDIQYMDLSTVVPNGNPNAIVVGSILQELDLQRNVVFQWRSWDYIPISQTYMNVASSSFDYVHVNAYQLDTDGNILACFRTIWSVIKINRTTGEIMWRLGGKANEFTFINENDKNKPGYFTFPHSLKKLDNGNIMLFDNGNGHTPQYSRAVEYSLDEVGKTATMVWEYRHTPDIFAPTQGSVQRMVNGNTVIGWGSSFFAGTGKTSITEVRPDKTTAFELEWVDPMVSYRAQKFMVGSRNTSAATLKVSEILEGNEYFFRKGDSIKTGVSIKFIAASAGYNVVTVQRYLNSPTHIDFPERSPFVQPVRVNIEQSGISSFTADITFDSTLVHSYTHLSKAVIYTREFEGTGMFFPLPTIYDSVRKTLTSTTTKFGEFIIGIPDEVSPPMIPLLELPINNGKVNQAKPLLFRWSSFGHFTGSHIQVAKDSLFTNVIINDSSIVSSHMMWNGFEHNTKYFWRAAVKNELGKSGWSLTGVFTTSGLFLNVQYPTRNEKFIPGSSYIIRYINNFEEWVNVRLYKNGNQLLRLKDSTENTGRFVWKVPATGLSADTTFTIRISSVLDSTIAAESPMFSIAAPSGVQRNEIIVKSFELFQNYPNPFNPSTVIQYDLPVRSHVMLSLFDILGKKVASLIDDDQNEGSHRYQFSSTALYLSSGIYFYQLRADNYSARRKMVILK